jgi:hypothetical protein
MVMWENGLALMLDGIWNSGVLMRCQILVLLTCGATLDVFCDPCLGAWPEVFFVDAPDCFVPSRMPVDGSFMPYVHQFVLQSLIRWYDEAVTLDVPPEWFIWVVNVFNWINACPFFHQRAVVVLNDGDGVLDRSIGVGSR